MKMIFYFNFVALNKMTNGTRIFVLILEINPEFGSRLGRKFGDIAYSFIICL